MNSDGLKVFFGFEGLPLRDSGADLRQVSKSVMPVLLHFVSMRFLRILQGRRSDSHGIASATVPVCEVVSKWEIC